MNAVIYGATGFTGRLIAEVLARRGLGFAIAGRDRARLEALADELDCHPEVRPAPVHDDQALRTAFEGATVVINCAGPFARLGEPVIQAAIASGAHYLDTAGEQRFLRNVFERYESAARKAEVCVINACAFEVALGDWAADLAADSLPGPPLDELSVSYAIDKFRPTTGTQLAMLSTLEEGGCVWSHDRWEPIALAAESRVVAYPEPFGMREAVSFPSGEVITVPRHVDTARVQTFLSVANDTPLGRALTRGASLFGSLLPTIVQSPLGALARAKLAEHVSHPSATQRQRTTFAITARAERSFERREVTVSGADPYGITAEVVAYGTERLIADGPEAIGVITPAEAFAAADGLSAMAERCLLTVVQA